jgi:LysR family transcriptional regulator, carnitine catabolism transcriptional activator
MNMTPRQLRAFVGVARSLSFARACEQLHLSQPALSLAIRDLERALGGRLFSRTTRQVRLTPEGADLLPLAEQLLADWERVGEQVRRRFALEAGHLAVAAMPSFAANQLPGLLRAYRAHYPEVALAIRDVIHEQVLELVESGRVEVGFCFEPESSPALTFEPLYVDRFIAIVPPDSALARRRTVTVKDLLADHFIALERPSSMRRLIETTLTEAGLPFDARLYCDQLTTVIQLVAAGLGVSVIPSLSRPQAEVAGVKCLELSSPVIRRPVGLVHRRDQQWSAAALPLVHFAREQCAPATTRSAVPQIPKR